MMDLLAITFIALLIYMTRILGVVVMAQVPQSPRLKRFIDTTAICVIVGMVATILIQAGSREFIAAAGAASTMLLVRNALWAMAAGISIAAFWLQIF